MTDCFGLGALQRGCSTWNFKHVNDIALMRAVRLMLLFAFASHVPAFAAEPRRPPAGQNVDESYEITLRTLVKAPCLAFSLGSSTVLLQRGDLEELARKGHEADSAPDPEMSRLNKTRAGALLSTTFTETKVKGCRLAQAIPDDGGWMILRHIELGRAGIVSGAAFAHKAIVRYSGSTGRYYGAGFVYVFLPGQATAIYSLPWWIT